MKLSRRSVLAAAPLTLLGSTGGGVSHNASASQSVALPDFGRTFGVDDAPVIQAALQHAAANRVELVWPGGTYRVRTPLQCSSVNIRFAGEVTVVYTGSAHVRQVFAIGMSGGDTTLAGRLIIDGRRLANVGLHISREDVTPADLIIGDIEARNCRMVRGHRFNGGAAGIIIRGNIGRLSAERLWAANISRAAGSGQLAYFGTSGIDISRTAGYAPRQIQLGVVGANNVTTDDQPGSALCHDIDGVAIFQNDVEGASLTLAHLHVTNAQGRALKTQCYRSCRVDRAYVLRSIAGMTDGSNEIAFQLGEGSLGRAEIVYRGDADQVHGQGTTCISSYTTTKRGRYGPTVFENITVRDETIGTARIRWVVDTTNDADGASNHSTTIRNLRLEGRSVGALVNVRRNGSLNRGIYTLDIAGFSGGLIEAVVLADGPAPNLRVRLSGVMNMGAAVPAIRLTTQGGPTGSPGRLELGVNRGVLRQ